MPEKRRGQESIEDYMKDIGRLLGVEFKHFDDLSQEEKIQASGVFNNASTAAANADFNANVVADADSDSEPDAVSDDDADPDSYDYADSNYTTTNKVAKKVSPKGIFKAKKPTTRKVTQKTTKKAALQKSSKKAAPK